jgi:predicted negative regulator of RcsB-dependent stress response
MNTQTSGWQRYIKVIVLMGAIALIALSAVLYTDHQKQKRIEEASLLYEGMLQAVRQKDVKKASEQALTLTEQYPRTSYAPLAALMLARIDLEKRNLPKATEHLQLAVRLGEKGPVEHIARVRLARLLMSEDKLDEALKLLSIPETEGYITLYEEAKGDVYFKQNDLAKAKACYLAALKAAPSGVPTTSLQLKYSDLNDDENSVNTVKEDS